MELQGNSVEHLSVFLQKLRNKTPFSIIRPGDGEYLVMNQNEVKTQDGWKFSGGVLRQDLYDVKNLIQGLEQCYVGIPCPGCHEQDMTSWYKKTWELQPKQITYACIFCNENWKAFTQYLIDSQHPIYYIGSGQRTDGPLHVVQRFPVSERLVDSWDKDKNTFLKDIYRWVGNQINGATEPRTFLFSAGPITKFVVPMLHQLYPGHQYVDVGSAIDSFMKPSSNRLYMKDTDIYGHTICDFVNGHRLKVQEITAILNFYKRPHVIHEQIAALREQTIPPKQIIIWRNYAEGYEFPDDIRADPSIIIMDCSKNMGVWARFAAALLANTEFICVFDDDTIPGRRWFENCLTTIKQVNGLLGTIGWRFHRNSQQYNSFEKRIGWDGPNYETREVDMVCHAWFFKRAWLPELFRIVPDYEMLFRSGEDMGLSYAFQQIGIKTFVPPHPPLDYDMYGSHPEKAVKYGCEPVSIWLTGTNFDEMFHFYKKRGFRFINDRT
jgi:hypothetical protein